MTDTISTIGYEGASLDDFINTLRQSGIRHVLDIRDRPLSRKPGFSKRGFSAALIEASIAYTHLQPLGDPKLGREAMRAGRREDFERIFSAHMERPEAVVSLQQAINLAKHTSAVLLCFEADHRCCHRRIVAQRMARLGSFAVRNLAMSCMALPRRRKRDAGAFAFG